MPSTINLGFLWPPSERERPLDLITDWVRERMPAHAAWTLITGRDPDRKDQLELGGDCRESCLAALPRVRGTYSPVLEGVLSMPGAVHPLLTTLSIYHHDNLVELCASIDEADFPRDGFLAALAGQLDLAAAAFARWAPRLGYLSRESDSCELGGEALAEVHASDCGMFELAFCSAAAPVFDRDEVPAGARLYRRGDLLVLDQGRSLLPDEVPPTPPPGAAPL